MDGSIALVNGEVRSMDAAGSHYPALVVEAGRISRLGRSPDLEAYAAERRIRTVDLGGRTVVPGAIDTHFHLILTGMSLEGVDFNACRSVDEVLQQLRDLAASVDRGRWIVGKGLDEFELKEKRPPTAQEIDRVCPANPVFIEDRGYHFALVNTTGFSALGFSPDAAGVRKTPDGKGISGQLMEEIAGQARNKFLAAMDIEQKTRLLRRGTQYAAECGVTTLHAIEGGLVTGDGDIPLLFELKDRLPARVLVYWNTFDVGAVVAKGVKAFGGDILLDGNLGSSTAALCSPYSDDPSTTGVLFHSQADINELVARTVEAGVQVGFHVIGDAAIEQALVAFELAAAHCPGAGRRFRLDHFGVPAVEQVDRAASMQVDIATQPPFAFRRAQPGGVYESRVGPARIKRAYPLRDLLDAGLLVGGGSDSSVMSPDYMLGIHSAVNHPNQEQRLTLQEAFELYTRNGARIGFEEAEKGSLEIGKLGDMVVLSQDPFDVPHEEIKDISVDMTIRGGEVVFDRQVGHEIGGGAVQ
jgi:predicted amidohydrolase YtcJ